MRFGPLAAMIKITVHGNVTWCSWVGGYQCVKILCPHCQAKLKTYPKERGVKIVRNVANYLTNKAAPYTGRR
jgi:hypothetical protein